VHEEESVGAHEEEGVGAREEERKRASLQID
jgi:hypothetical protein